MGLREGLGQDVAARVQQAGPGAGSDWLDHIARIGLIAYGLVHLMVAWLAIQLAFGDREGSASHSGAVQEIAQQPFGEVLVWGIAVGMFLLAIWQGIEAIAGYRDEEGFTRVRKRLASAGKAVVYVVIGLSAVKVASGSRSGSSEKQTDSMTATVMDLPAGQVLVGGIGLAVLGIGVGFAVRAWTEAFVEHLTAEGRSGNTGTAYLWFGKIGYTAKGVALGIIGGLFCYAAVTHEPDKSGGLDQALRKVLDQPFGPALLTAIGIGIGCYGIFCFARARHLSR